MSADEAEIRRLTEAVKERPLEPDDPRYIKLYSPPWMLGEDPVEQLAQTIRRAQHESAQLFSGFRGVGKSTELRRLRRVLQGEGYKVILVDLEEYLDMSAKVHLHEFLMVVAGAFSDALEDEQFLGADPRHEGYWTRLSHFLRRTRIVLEDASLPGDLKVRLKHEVSFRQQLQTLAQGHLRELITHVRDFAVDCVVRLRERFGEAQVVLLVDSLEHIRASLPNASEVHQSVADLFAAYGDKLRLPQLHVVYMVPPYVKVIYPQIGAGHFDGDLALNRFKGGIGSRGRVPERPDVLG